MTTDNFYGGLAAIWIYGIFLLLVVMASFSLRSVWNPPEPTLIHSHGHQCLVLNTGFTRSMSCDWNKP